MPATTVATNRNASPRGNSQPVVAVPFIRASGEHREPFFDITRTLSASDQDLGVIDVSAYGYLRSIVLLVQASGGTGTAVTTAEDGPFSALKGISLSEPNGATIVNFNTGHDLYLAHKWGGYRGPEGADFRSSPTFSAPGATTGNFSFMLRIPLEISARDGLGSLVNQSAASTFKLRLALAKAAEIYGGTVPSAMPSVRIRGYIEAWDQPEAQTGGAVNEVSPPAPNTTQFWSSQTLPYVAGQNTLKLSRVGNYIRNLIFIVRRNNTSRANGHSDMADPLSILFDVRPLDTIERNNWLHQMYERSGFGGVVGSTTPALDSAKGLDAGVFVYDFMHEFDGSLGRENRDGWLPTLSSTRLELNGSFQNSGTVTVLTNDVSVAGNVFM